MSPSVPKTVHDVLDTFHHTRCPITGWDKTICGTYQDIADTVNTRFGSSYDTTDIGNALTWLHEWGPDVAGATINKCGPGNRKTVIRFDDYRKAPVVVSGSVYMLLIDGVVLPTEKQVLIRHGLTEWCEYRISSCRNDVIDISMYRSNIDSTTTDGRRQRAALQKAVNSLADEISTLQSLRGILVP